MGSAVYIPFSVETFQGMDTRRFLGQNGMTPESKLRHWPPGTILNTVRAVLFFKLRTLALSALSSERSVQPDADDGGLVRFPKTTAFLLILPLLFGAGFVAAPSMAHERYRLMVLRNEVERAAGPSEVVLVDGWLPYHLLAWKGSPALRQQMRRANPVEMAAVRQRRGEFVVVTTDGSPMADELRADGFVMTADVSQGATIASGNAVSLPGQGLMRIYFARSGSPQPVAP
jgi:hypothetical protein